MLQRTPIYTFPQENTKFVSIEAFMELLAEPLGCAGGCPGPLVENHWCRAYVISFNVSPIERASPNKFL